ncbi:PepSY domain-containing protein [Prevotella fusca]|nr:PepSY-associated TM helix domain-containing protein [Prevotella fusca]
MKEQAQKQDGASQDMKKDGQDKKSGGKKLFKKLHTGKWGGWFSMILHAIAVLIGGFLPISGYYMWWKRNYGKKAKA